MPLCVCMRPGLWISSPGEAVDLARTQPRDSCICFGQGEVSRGSFRSIVGVGHGRLEVLVEEEEDGGTYDYSEDESLIEPAVFRLG